MQRFLKLLINMLTVGLRRRRKLGNSDIPWDGFAVTRVVTSTLYNRNSFLKGLDCWSCGQIVEGCDIDKEIKNFVVSRALRVHSIDGFSKNTSPCLNMGTDFVLVVRER